MTELNPDENQLNNGSGGGGGVGGSQPATTSDPVATISTVGSKRQRRPSVRLGEIGDNLHHHHHQAYDSNFRRSTAKQWQRPLNSNRKDSNNQSGKGLRTKTLTNLSSDYKTDETLDEEREGNFDSMAIGSWRVKKRVGGATTKRVRSNWVSKTEETQNNNNNFNQQEDKYSGGEEEMEDGYRDFNREDSESPLKEMDNSLGNQEREELYITSNRRRYTTTSNSNKGRAQENREFELSEPSEMDGGDWRNGRGEGGGGREGVRIWLEGLGLGRYWPVFEIHEVDDEVLPLLTLEDLKDMGINAVGSRRKMYCAIQKLGKEFS